MRGLIRKFIVEVLRFEGFVVVDTHWETPTGIGVYPVGVLPFCREARLVVTVERKWMGRCVQCGGRCRKVYEHLPCRRWEDLPWSGRPVAIAYAPDRLWCPRCKRAQVELLPWADPYQRETRRFQ